MSTLGNKETENVYTPKNIQQNVILIWQKKFKLIINDSLS